MAALMRHGLTSFAEKINSHRLNSFIINNGNIAKITHNSYLRKLRKKIKVETDAIGRQKLKATEESIASKGFLRTQKPYTPPNNVSDKVLRVCMSALKENEAPSKSYEMKTLDTKFAVLKACFEEFNHVIPSSQLHKIQNIGDVITFYETPVSTTTPLDAMRNMDLPPNLHVMYDYHRFHPDTDTKFGGISAFPESSTLVTGLRYKKKYQGYIAERKWPEYSEE